MGSDIDTRHARFAAAAIFLLALFLRLWGIGFALPYDLTPDEPHHIVQALRIGAGEGGPLLRIWHTVGKGGLDYLLFFEYGALYVFWRLTGEVGGPDDFAIRYLEDPTAFYLLGRLTVAVLGALTVVIVYHVGRRMFDARVGLGAAFIGTTAYFHGAQSHLINVHVPMAFALWAGVACYLAYERDGRLSRAVGAGALIGLATALAYSAAVGLVLVLLALGTSQENRPRLQAVFAIGAPFLLAVLLVSPDLLSGIGGLVSNFAGSARTESVPGGELRQSIDAVTILRPREPWGYSWILVKPVNLLVSAGAALGALVGLLQRSRSALLLASVSALSLPVLSLAARSPAERYLLPIIPALWLLCGLAARTLSRGRLVWNAALLSAAAALPLWDLIGQDYIWTRPDTRIVAKSWIEENVPADAKILMDGMRFRFVQSPPLKPNDATLERRLSSMETSELTLSKRMLSLYAEAQKRTSGPKYDLHSTVYGLEVQDLDHYVEACFDYVVTSSWNENRHASEDARERHPASARFYDALKTDERFDVVFEVEPARWRHGGPIITIYRVESACRPAP